jgi:hypothetical protein
MVQMPGQEDQPLLRAITVPASPGRAADLPVDRRQVRGQQVLFNGVDIRVTRGVE